MNAWECPREADVLDAVAAGRWAPDWSAPGEGTRNHDPEIAAHLAACALCRDLALVASAMSADHDAAYADAAPPSSDLVWWRAQLRARTEAAQAAARPIAIAQGVGLALALMAMIAAIVGFGDMLASAASGMIAGTPAFLGRLPLGADTAAFVLRGALLAIGVWIALIPIAVYLAADE